MSSATWGLGIEHELAPAVLTPSGVWKRIRPQKLNERAEKEPAAPPKDVQFVDMSRVSFLRVQPGKKTNVKRWSSTMRSLLSWCTLYFMKKERSIAQRDVETEYPLPADGFKYHRDLCDSIAAAITEVCTTNGFKRVSIVLEYQYETRVYVYQDASGMPLPEVADSLFASTAGVVYRKNTLTTRVRGQFEIDSGFIEIKSDKPIRATIGSIAAELDAREREVLAAARKVATKEGIQGQVGILPHGQVILNDGSSLDFIPTYAGSYHVWITLPHVLGAKFDHPAFVADHVALIRALQWVEPLMLACMPCDPRCPGTQSASFSRASLRSRMNGLGGFGTTDMAAVPQKRGVMCFKSLDALNAGAKPGVVQTDAVWLVTKNGERLNLMACQQSLRKNYRRVDERWEDGTGFPIHNAGNDVRFLSCWSCDGAETHHDYANWVRHGNAFCKDKNGDVRVVAKDPKTGLYTWDEPTCVDGKPIGIEFRVFDHMPGEYAKDLLSLVVLIAASAKKPAPFAPKDAAWMLQMRDCAAHGSRVPVSKDYWNGVCAALGVSTGKKLPETAYAALNALIAAMHSANGGNAVAKTFGYKDANPTAFTFPDVNFPAWKDGLVRKLQTDTDLSSRIGLFLSRAVFDVKTIDDFLGRDWRDDLYMLKALAAEA